MCRNSNRKFLGRSEALRHAELHLAGLIVNAGEEEEEDSDSTSGGFSSDHDCLSTDEEHDSDLSSVSERETEESDHNEEEGEDDNLCHVGNNVVRKLLLYNYQQVFVNYSKCVKSFQMLG